VLATLRAGVGAVRALVADPDPLGARRGPGRASWNRLRRTRFGGRRASAAVAGVAGAGGRARALSDAAVSAAVPALAALLSDEHVDVRRRCRA
jgi:hypothetical protein